MVNHRWILIILLFNCFSGLAQVFTDVTPENLPKVWHGSIDWGDYDNDSDLDILISGFNNDGSYTTSIYKNDDGTFELLNDTDFTKVWLGAVEWGDYDSDGDLDILVAGATVSQTEYDQVFSVYENLGNDTFTMVPTDIQGMHHGKASWGDYNNDGLMDIGIVGNNNTSIYKNEGHGHFRKLENLSLQFVFQTGRVEWVDYDNDGDLDFTVAGWSGNDTRGSIMDIYKNEGNDLFVMDSTASQQIEGTHSGDIDWGDYDQDGDMDVLVVGNRRVNGRNLPSARIYNNNNGMFSENTLADLWVVDEGSAKWGDANNDGNLDILLTSGAYSSVVTYLYINNADGTFLEQEEGTTGLLGFDYSDLDWGDFDQDGDLDLLIIGRYQGNIRLYRNETDIKNSSPNPPSNLVAQIVNESLYLSWDMGSDLETSSEGLSYNVYLKSSKSSKVSGMANLETGLRTITNFGNAGQNLFWASDNLYGGTYQWSVQSIDNSFDGSEFAEEKSFTIPLLSNFSPDQRTICESETLIIHYTGNAPPDATFEWDFDEGTLLYDSAGFYEITWETWGEKQLSLQVSIGTLQSETTYQSVFVNSLPSIQIEGDSLLAEGDIIDLSIIIDGGIPPYSFELFDGIDTTTLTTDESTTSFEVSKIGTYSIVSLIDANGCEASTLDSLTISEYVVTSTPNILVNEDISIYPNPVTNLLTIESKEMLLYVKIYSIGGQLVKSIDLDSPRNNIKIPIRTKPGIYVLELSNIHKNQISKKVIIN